MPSERDKARNDPKPEKVPPQFSRFNAMAIGVLLIAGLGSFGLTVYLAFFALRRTPDFVMLTVGVFFTPACLCFAKWVQTDGKIRYLVAGVLLQAAALLTIIAVKVIRG